MGENKRDSAEDTSPNYYEARHKMPPSPKASNLRNRGSPKNTPSASDNELLPRNTRNELLDQMGLLSRPMKDFRDDDVDHHDEEEEPELDNDGGNLTYFHNTNNSNQSFGSSSGKGKNSLFDQLQNRIATANRIRKIKIPVTL